MKTIEKIIRIFPLATFLAILASSVKLAIYYGFFGLNIVDYLGVAEYVPLFIDDLHLILVYGIGFSFTLLWIRDDLKGVENRNSDKKNKEKKKQNILNLEHKYSRPFYSFLFISPIVLCTIVYFFFEKDQLKYLNRVLASLYFMSIVGWILAFSAKKKLTYLYLWCVLVLFVPLILSGFKNAVQLMIEQKEPTRRVLIRNCSECSNYLYLGKSKEYIFFFNKEQNEAVVRPIDDLLELRVSRKVIDWSL